MRHLGIAILAIPLLAGPAIAQSVTEPVAARQGFWISGGLGYGSSRLSCDVCQSGRVGGPTGYLRLGATVTPSFMLGGELLAWSGSADSATVGQETVSRFSGAVFAVAYWYPITTRGLFLKGGVGWVSFRGGGDQLSVSAVGGIVGFGYDIPAGRVSIVPFVNYLATANGSPKLDNVVLVGDAFKSSVSLFQVGLGVTWN